MRRIITSSIIVLVIVGLVTAGYFFYRRYSGDVTEAMRAVPQDAAFVIEFRNTQNALFDLKQTEYWQRMAASPSMQSFKESLSRIDSVFSNDADFSSSWKQKPVIISAHVTEANDFDWLFLLEVPRGVNEKDVAELTAKLLSVHGDVSKREYEGVLIYDIAIGNNKTFSFALHKGILMCSYTSFLVEDAIRQLKSGISLKSNKSFINVYKSSGKNTDADFYFNYKSFSRFLNIFTNPSSDIASRPEFSLITALADWSEADIKFNTAAVLMSGYAAIKDTNQLLALIKNQQPHEMQMADILPARTSYLFHFGLSDSKLFFQHLQYSGFNDAEIKTESLLRLKKHSAVSYRNNLTSWVGGEMALVITEANTVNYSNNIFACIQANDTLVAMRALKELSAAAEPVKGASVKTERYNGHEIGLIKAEGLLGKVYGKLFESIQKNYFTSVGNYIVFANQASSLRSFIDDADSKRNLSSDNTFKQVLANSESSSNIFVYINIPRSINIIRSISSDALVHALGDKENAVNPEYSGFSAIALQYANKNNLVYNHFVLQFSEEAKSNVSLVWSAQCDTSIHMKPQAVTDGSSNYFLVEDDANQLYLVDAGGQIVLKKQLNEKIMGGIYSVDFFRNGTKQFLFNTSSYLYVMDKSGAFMGNYPIRLPAPASAGCTIADFGFDGELSRTENNQDYKIFVPCSNQMIYAYDMNGKAMIGWLYDKPTGNISHPVTYFKVKDKDYLVVATDDGKIEFLDRRGALRVKTAERIGISPLSTIVPVDTGDAARAHVVLADSSGDVFAIYTDGHVSKIFANHLTPPVFFDAEDINNDGKPEYILFGNNTINVHQADSSLLYTHEIKESAQFISVAVSGGVVGSVSSSTDQVTIYNSDGTVYPGFPVKGSTAFTVVSLNNDGKKYVVINSSDGNLYLYVME